VLIADGGSTDGTRELLDRIAGRDPRVQVVPNPDRIQAPGMNRLLRASRGDVIVRMDVHCQYAPDYVRRCVEELARSGADNVGGAQRALARTSFQQALCAALDSPAGVGGARYRSAANEGYVDTVFLGAFRRRVFETVGLYDPGAFTNEDAELNQRILEAGGKVFLSRAIVVHYYPRSSFGALFRQYFRYGLGRARTLWKHGRFRALRPAIPFLMLVAALGLAVVPPLRPLLLPAAALYVLLAAVEAVRVGRRLGAAGLVTVFAIFPVLHLAHGLGFAVGLVRYGLRRDFAPVERLPERPRAPV
jgi:GT2 family glycosyltransferase